MLFYTSLTYDTFKILHETLEASGPLNYYKTWNVTPSCLTLENQLLLCLMKLRLNYPDLDLADRFRVSRATVSNVFYTLFHALYEILFEGVMNQSVPSQLKCKGCMPKCFDDFPSARFSMDCTETSQDIPTDLDKQCASYSNYKSRHTVKALTCVAPNGAIVYCSKLYPGSVSDRGIVEHSKVLSHLQPGDLVLADKGFTIFDLMPPGVSLNIPPFLIGKAHFTAQEAKLCYKIARSRIHVERANERIKNYRILHHIPATYRPISSKLFQLCCCLVNLQAPLLKEVADKYEILS